MRRIRGGADTLGYEDRRRRVHYVAYQQRRSTAAGRDLVAYLAHRHTTAKLRALAARLAQTIQTA